MEDRIVPRYLYIVPFEIATLFMQAVLCAVSFSGVACREIMFILFAWLMVKSGARAVLSGANAKAYPNTVFKSSEPKSLGEVK